MSVVFIKVSVACRYHTLDSMLNTWTMRNVFGIALVTDSSGMCGRKHRTYLSKEICSLVQLSKIKGTVPSEETIFLFYPRQAGAKQVEESQEKIEFLREK